MFKRILILLLFTIFNSWLHTTLSRNVPQWFPAPGRVGEAFILTAWGLLLVGALALEYLLWKVWKLDQPTPPERSWEQKNSFRLPSAVQKSSAAVPTPEKSEHREINFPGYALLCVVIFIFYSFSDADEDFSDAVNCEYYLTADICHHVLQANPDREDTLYLLLANNRSDDKSPPAKDISRQVKYLLSKGADTNRAYQGRIMGATPMSLAITKCHRHLLPLLESYGGKFNNPALVMEPLLAEPIRDGDVECVRKILSHGENVCQTISPESRETALHYVAQDWCSSTEAALEIAELLLEARANVNAIALSPYPPFAQTPLDMAEEPHAPFPAMAELLKRHGGKRAREIEDAYLEEHKRKFGQMEN